MRTLAYRLSLVLIFTIPWEGVLRIPGVGTAAKLIGLVVGVLWVTTVIVTGGMRKPDPFLIAACIFVAWLALSVLWSADPVRSVKHAGTWVQCLLFAFILWDLYRTRAHILAGLQAYILGAYAAVGGALTNYFSGHMFYTHYDRFSPGATNPDGFGFIVALGVPVAWYLASSPSTTRFPRLFKVLNYAYLPIAFLGLALSGTRTATVAALVGMAFGLVALRRLRLPARIAVVMTLALAIYFLVPVVEPLRSFQRLGTTEVEATQGTWNGRLLNWDQGLASFAEHPIFGIGAYMYPTVNTLSKAAHNSFLAVLVELGLIGFVLFAVVLAIVVAHALTLPRWDKAFWLTVLLVWTIGSFTLTWGHRKSTWLFLTLLVASSMVTRRRERPVIQEPATPATLALAGRST